MFNPVRAYRKYVQRLELKRKVFDSEKNTLNLQALNLFVNGEPEKPRTAPTCLRAKTRDLLGNTIVQGMNSGKYGGELREVANNLVTWCSSPRAADNPKVRHWLKQLAEAKPTWTVAQLIKDFGGDEGTHVSSEDDAKSNVSFKEVAPSPHSSEDEFDWSAAVDDARERIGFAIPSDVESGKRDVGGSTQKSVLVDGNLSAENVSKRENVPKDVSKGIDPRGRRPLPLLRPKSDSTQPRNGVVHMVDGEVVPAKQ